MLVPKLRFKEFSDEWKCKLFGDVFYFLQNNSYSRDRLNYNDDGNIYNIHYGDILVKFGEIIDFNFCQIPKINSEVQIRNFEVESYLKDGDIIVADTAEDSTVGKTCEIINIKHKLALSGLHTIPCRTKFDFALQYLGNYINSLKYHKQLIPLITGIKVSSISKRNIVKTRICYPCLKEQEKIAIFFSLLNKKIELQQRKKDALKMYKKGLYQKIFSNIINYEKLGNLITQKSIRNKNYENYEVLSVSNKQGFILQNEQFEDREVASEDKSNYKIVSKNDFAFNPARINVGSIARLKNRENGIISPMYTCFQCKKELNCNYFEHLLNTDYMHREIIKRLEGSVRLCLSFEAMANIKIPFSDIENQKYLGDFLEKINKKINIIDKNRESLCTLKKGLLQQMFI